MAVQNTHEKQNSKSATRNAHSERPLAAKEQRLNRRTKKSGRRGLGPLRLAFLPVRFQLFSLCGSEQSASLHHGSAMNLFHFGFFVCVRKRSVRHYGIRLCLCTQMNLLDLNFLIVAKIQPLEHSLAASVPRWSRCWGSALVLRTRLRKHRWRERPYKQHPRYAQHTVGHCFDTH
jgi:hypothetical protein